MSISENTQADENSRITSWEAETFTDDQINNSLKAFIDFGEQTKGKAHGGYFSGFGFAARAVRYHLKQREGSR